MRSQPQPDIPPGSRKEPDAQWWFPYWEGRFFEPKGWPKQLGGTGESRGHGEAVGRDEARASHWPRSHP
jgi:hypothetical protein